MGMSKHFQKCTGCGHKEWVTCFTGEEDTVIRPEKCPRCGGGWTACDPAESDKRLGDLHQCGRCQKESLGGNSAWVRNAPAGMHDSWCLQCIEAVNRGAAPVLYGVSIDKEGFVIASRRGKPGQPPTLKQSVAYLLVVLALAGLILLAVRSCATRPAAVARVSASPADAADALPPAAAGAEAP